MSHFLKSITEKKTEEVLYEQETEDAQIFLPQTFDFLDLSKQYKQLIFFYESGIRQLTAKLQILDHEFQNYYERNPIETISSRVKSPESILRKMQRKGLPLTSRCMMENLHDIAGVRVICPFVSDVYQVAKMLAKQTDINVAVIKDYIRNPKENGYRSLHLIVTVDVFFTEGKKKVPVEIQLRTMAMDFWASLEHQLRYKKEKPFTAAMHEELFECSQIMAKADEKMQRLAEQLDK